VSICFHHIKYADCGAPDGRRLMVEGRAGTQSASAARAG
jgi:hypothetical protein